MALTLLIGLFDINYSLQAIEYRVNIKARSDPGVFQHVLNFMRGQPPKLEILQRHQIDHLLSDAEVNFHHLDYVIYTNYPQIVLSVK